MSRRFSNAKPVTPRAPHATGSVGRPVRLNDRFRADERPLFRRRRRRIPWWLMGFAAVLVVFGLLDWNKPHPSFIDINDAHALAAPQWPLSSGEMVVPTLSLFESRSISHTVRSGDTWASIGSALNFDTLTAMALDKAQKEKAKISVEIPRNLRIGQELTFEFDSSNTLTTVSTSPALGMDIVFSRRTDGTFGIETTLQTRSTVERVLRAKITPTRSSFAEAAKAAGANYDVVDDLVDLFSDRINFRRDFRYGDRIVAIFHEHLLADGTPVGIGPVLAAALVVQGETYAAVRYEGGDGETRYFNEDGELLGNTFLRYPLRFTRISSQFSKARFHPVLRRYRPHNGVDFAAPVGTPVRSVAEGRITFAGWKGPAGKMVKIRHTKRYSTAYLHLSRINKGIRKGARVKRGEIIGAVGSTGRSTGPHLHYSFYDNGRYVDPMKIKLPTIDNLDKRARIDKPFLDRVLLTLRRYLRQAGYQDTSREVAAISQG